MIPLSEFRFRSSRSSFLVRLLSGGFFFLRLWAVSILISSASSTGECLMAASMLEMMSLIVLSEYSLCQIDYEAFMVRICCFGCYLLLGLLVLAELLLLFSVHFASHVRSSPFYPNPLVKSGCLLLSVDKEVLQLVAWICSARKAFSVLL